MTDTKRILVVEDDARAAELIRRALEAENDLALELAGSLAEGRESIDRRPPDVVIAALKLPDGRGTDLIPGFELVAMYPVVVMAGSGDETTAVEAMKAGALDYVVKSEATLLGMAQVVRRALREWIHLVERRRAEIAFQVSEMRFRSLYDDNPSMFFTVERDGTMSSVNRYGAEMLGYEVEELIGRSFEDLYPEDQRQTLRRHVERCFAEQETLQRWEARKRHQDGSTLWVRATARVVVGDDGEPSLLIVCEDLTETRTLSEILNYESSHDSLTGLLNRREFERRLTEALRRSEDAATEHALCYVDLSQFQLVNETWGHDLRTLPVDFVKIDGIFVKGILDDPADDVLVASINRVAHALGKRTIAEYVESEQILRRMAEIGVDFVQGYGVGRPEPIGEMGGLGSLRALGGES